MSNFRQVLNRQLADGLEFVSITGRSSCTAGMIPGRHVILWLEDCSIVNGNRTCYLPTCGIVPQPATTNYATTYPQNLFYISWVIEVERRINVWMFIWGGSCSRSVHSVLASGCNCCGSTPFDMTASFWSRETGAWNEPRLCEVMARK
jgi:hypothetical protein